MGVRTKAILWLLPLPPAQNWLCRNALIASEQKDALCLPLPRGCALILSLWHGDQNCQCFLSQPRQNVVMFCTPGEVLVRLGHVRGGRFHVPSSQGDGTLTSPKASFCLVGSLPLGMVGPTPKWGTAQHHSETCNPAAGCRATAGWPPPRAAL